MSKYSFFDCPRVLVIFVSYEYNFMIARPFILVVYVDVPCLFLCIADGELCCYINVATILSGMV